jgi:hypothetical protein
MANEKDRIEEFWAWFSKHIHEFSRPETTGEGIWELALQHLKKVDVHFWFELSRDRHPVREFIVTVEGHTESFPIAEEFVRLAPNIEGWTFKALKPAQGFQFKTTYEGTLFDPRQMWFLPLQSESHPDDLGLRVAVAGLDGMDKRKAHNAVLIILDTGIGERSAALDIQHIELTELPTDPASLGYIELPELAYYIAWRKKRHASPSA